MPTHEQQRQNATGADDRYNSGAGASGNTYAQQGVGGYAQQVRSPSPMSPPTTQQKHEARSHSVR